MDSTVKHSSSLLEVLSGKKTKTPPLWLMRQAGRYLPEYRELRARSTSFLDFCYTPKSALAATLQPIKRFEFDAAIVFSDILVIPDALGQNVSFEVGEGPRLDPIDSAEKFKRLKEKLDLNFLSPVFETIELARAQLPKSTALIGFCGAPWTVASYMIAGRGTPDQAPARLFAYQNEELFKKLIDLLTDSSIEYLVQQFRAGADVVQIFDSWSGVLPTSEFEKWCYNPIQKIVSQIRLRLPNAPIIAFPRGANTHLQSISAIEGLSAVGLDTSTDLGWAAREIQTRIPVQGNLDPLALLAGGDRLRESVSDILTAFADRPHIFNLGHGILPSTPIEHVEQLVRQVRDWRAP